MEQQIILLPRKDYWAWVRACRGYVLAFGANMTSDLQSALATSADQALISFPLVANGYPEFGDLQEWLRRKHPQLRIDPIPAASPEELSAVLSQRVADGDRFGRNRQSFSLRWPTIYNVVTQVFGANPEIYARYGLPGHEGIDIRAREFSNIFCCADGVVYAVQMDPQAHAYGLHVRVAHRDGYKTIYAHLAEISVRPGEQVKAGDLIGKADSTGNSSGSHLHLTLKHEGATQRGETHFPNDCIDPAPFLRWPEELISQTQAFALSVPGCRLGAQGRIGGELQAADLQLVRQARLDALCISPQEPAETIAQLRDIHPDLLLIARLAADLSRQPLTAEAFVARVGGGMRRLRALGVRHFEILGAPNLQSNGWGRSWDSGAAFGRWFVEVCQGLKSMAPDVALGFPGLSPGEAVAGLRENWQVFLEGAEPYLALTDWIGVHCYWTNHRGLHSSAGGRLFEHYLLRFPEEELMITEFGNPASEVSAVEKGRQYLDFHQLLQPHAAIKAAFAVALSASAGYDALVWRSAANGRAAPIAEILGARL